MRRLLFPATLLSLALVAQEHAPAAQSAHKPVSGHGAAISTQETPDTPAAALVELTTGNGRFMAGKRTRTVDTSHDAALRASLLKGQSPFAVIITCSDSRVPDSLLFDQEAGRLFTIREAGNAPDSQGIASVEYAAEHLGSKLVVLLGHTSCGAIKAVREANGKPLPGYLWAIQAGMAGLLETTPQDPNEDAKAHTARLEEANARRQAQALVDRSALLRELVEAEKLWIVPAVYHLDSGKVEFFKPVGAAAAPQAHH
jgi:carbonic anhydrase